MQASSLFRRLLFGIMLAVLVAAGLGAALVAFGQPDLSAEPLRTTAATIQRELELRIDQPDEMRAHLARVHAATGLDLRLMTDLSDVPRAAKRAQRRDAITFVNRARAFIPISRGDEVVAVVELRSAAAGKPLLRAPLFMGCIMVCVLLAAGALFARQIARPLEQVAGAARRFGAGNLAVRVGVQPHAPRELAEVGVAFDDMAARIEHLISDQRALLGAVSHELRSPLTRALLALAIARSKHEDEPTLAIAEREIETTNAILEDLLLTVRVGLSDLRRTTCSADDLKAALTALHPPPAALRFKFELGTDLYVDRALLVRALENLVQNAYKYGHAIERPLDVAFTRHGSRIRFAVSDNGRGFSKDLLPRAFDAFARGDAARTPSQVGAAPGVGLGLALVQRIAFAHGGSVGVENRIDPTRAADAQGACVWFEVEQLPIPVAPT